MNYKKIHDSIIARAQDSGRKKSEGIYYEVHHIIPKCFGGTNRKSNLVLLTAKEHYLVHRLLVELQEKSSRKYFQMLTAFTFFAAKSKNHSRVQISSRYYESIRTELAQRRVGIPRSEEVKAKIRATKKQRPVQVSESRRVEMSNRMKGQNNPMYGKTHSDETRKKLSATKKGVKHPTVSESNRRRRGEPTASTRAVQQLTPEGTLLKTYVSIAEAVRQTGIRSIIGALRGNWYLAGGYSWKYVDNSRD